MAADENQRIVCQQIRGNTLIEPAALRGEKYDGWVGLISIAGALLEVLDGVRQRRSHHHHPGAAAVGIVVDSMVSVGRVLAQLVDRDIDEPVSCRTRHDAGSKRAVKHLGEERDDANSHVSAPTKALIGVWAATIGEDVDRVRQHRQDHLKGLPDAARAAG